MALFAGIGTALKTSAMARWIAGGAAALVTALTWLALHDAKVRKIERLKAAERTRKAADKTLDKMEKESNETIENAREARSAISDGIDSGSLRDDYADILFSDREGDA